MDHDKLGEVLGTDVADQASLCIDHADKAGCALKHGKHAIQTRLLTPISDVKELGLRISVEIACRDDRA